MIKLSELNRGQVSLFDLTSCLSNQCTSNSDSTVTDMLQIFVAKATDSRE